MPTESGLFRDRGIGVLPGAINSRSREVGVMGRVARAGLGLLEDPVGKERPLWFDLSRHQGAVNFSILVAAGMLGCVCRSGVSWGYADDRFPAYWAALSSFPSIHRSAYHVLYPDQPALKQMDFFYTLMPSISGFPRVLDLEKERGMGAGQIADFTMQCSDIIASRDGLRPIIYSRYLLVNEWLASWSDAELNLHYYWLAQYLWDRFREHPGPPTLPNRLNRDRVLIHQTADKKAGPPGGVESKSLDWDRWERGDAAAMHSLISSEFGGPAPEPDWAEALTTWARSVDPPYDGPDP